KDGIRDATVTGVQTCALPIFDFMQMSGFVDEPLVIERGEGVRVWDSDGKSYLDGLSGIFVVNMGHGRAEIVAAIQEQVARLAFVDRKSVVEGKGVEVGRGGGG